MNNKLFISFLGNFKTSQEKDISFERLFFDVPKTDIIWENDVKFWFGCLFLIRKEKRIVLDTKEREKEMWDDEEF